MSTSWDPDPDAPHITVVVKKTGRMVGLKAANSPSPHEYPFVQMIGVGTPIDTCQEIDIGDRLKSINGMFLKGKGRQDIHKLVREIEVGYDIVFQVIKSFKDKKFVQEMGSVGFRVASVRRQNPLLAMQLVDDAEPEEILEEEPQLQPQGRKGRSISEADEVDVIMADGVAENDESNEFGGFDEEDNDDAYVGKLGRKASTYGGFGGDDDVKSGSVPSSNSNTQQNTIDINGEDFGFGAMDNEDQWG
eukprot:m.119258 g.119258  ORF g.119258 m.119258 type:complete len:247 (+) comp28720_c2_seq6:233-973(+)